ncbi:MAG: sigma-70 family RNA polymerase sigma factor, partial [Clostridia bacterium]|nr:sigma-70 family RNA polymerase sigma factor [Clostridia bacterium]
MYYNKVEICGVNTARLPMLTSTEKKELLRKTRNGDMTAREELIDGNLRLVLSIIQRFAGRRESMDDLFQVGCIGLIKAVDNFNPELEVEFSTYAVPMILGECRRFLRDFNTIRVSRSVRDLAYRALGMREKLAAQSDGDPSLETIAEQLGEKLSDVSHALEAITEPVSLYETVYSDGGDSICVMEQL